jgi:hypothetical protein
MITHLTGQEFLLIIPGIILAYYIILWWCYRKPFASGLIINKGQSIPTVKMQASGFPHDLIARPVEVNQEEVEILLERQPWEEHALEMLDDDDAILIKEAEKLTEQIQEQINHMASNPPNPEEAYTKIGAIVRQYKIFENTEYFEPINRFIALAVNRDCNIQWTEQELLALWK